MRTLESTPAADGFAMPAEWEPHDGCWLAWPQNGYVWRNGARPAQRDIARLANALADTGEQVTVTVAGDQYPHARALLDGRVRVLEMSSWLAWARDAAPTFVVDAEGRRRGVDFPFNGYGGQYPSWVTDDRYASKVLDATRTERYRAPLVLEGGAFHVDGRGTCLVTAETLLDPARNPSPCRDEMTALLRDHLGVTKVIWLERGLAYDATRGHVDNMACFAAPGVVCLAWTDDERDPQYERSAAALEQLAGETDAEGRPLRVEKLHVPGPLLVSDEEASGIDAVRPPGRSRPGGHPRGRAVGGGPGNGPDGTRGTGSGSGPARLPASYCNFYVTADHLFAPLLDPDHDDQAMSVLSRVFPRHTVVGLPTRELLLGGGNIHCATQQIPSRIRRTDPTGPAATPRRD
ncbi:agmatine deiminase family protein [Streptomyces cacaoi]|uniref:agmatine deiminase family protein n=1 Tax=Streptomyces cacaoi TaxID=1898 RepID=UPI00331B5119